MIDFRYHLISLVAVFLSLGLGLLIGSAVIADNLIEDIEDRLEDVRTTNEERLAEIVRLRSLVANGEDFARFLEPSLVNEALGGSQIVLFVFEGSEDGLIDGLRAVVEEAGGDIATTVFISDRFALDDPNSAQELSLITGHEIADPAELREQIARELGSVAAAAATSDQRRGNLLADQRLDALIEELEEAQFLSIDRDQDPVTIPVGAEFIVAAGSLDEPVYEIDGFGLALAGTLADRGAKVIAVESADSVWGLVEAVRGDSDVADGVATVDHADTVPGRIATALALSRAAFEAGHYGYDRGAQEPFPSSGI
ncbi:MAG TPA: copper transporter [Actinomycetota bacterium]|nr:copper transporter [Actinomycetota bacterium]